MPLFSWCWATLGASLAAVAALLIFLLPVLKGPSPSELLTEEIVSAHVRSLMANHLTDVASSDQHTVKPWFNGKLDFSPLVVDLTDSGFPLVGGRLDFVANGSVAALVYQRRQHFINLFIWPSLHDSDVAASISSRQGYNMIRWVKSGMIYWAVSDVNISDLESFVQLIEGQG
jgi:anti-sigma factor RsiW